MDGTLVDTEPYWMAAEFDLVGSFGGEWTHEKAVQLVGQGLWHSARILQANGVALSEEEIIDRLTNRVIERIEESIPWRPGSLELLGELAELGVKNALVTMSIRRMAEAVTTSIGFDAFATLITGDEVTHAKPHPQPYELGAAAFGVTASECVAIEDSAPGVASAVASGAVVIAMPLHVPLLEDAAFDLWENGAEGKSADDLFAVYRSRRSA
jgi:HAD superfamily hydrolase (TIGR01509 family)